MGSFFVRTLVGTTQCQNIQSRIWDCWGFTSEVLTSLLTTATGEQVRMRAATTKSDCYFTSADINYKQLTKNNKKTSRLRDYSDYKVPQSRIIP